ncbi:ATP-binding protein [Reyranella sp.]|uniref:ATP-binding protein n=1 Tax=Reyranella sp. TaxID=1929291 RepID=UPI003D11BB7E
MRVRDWLRSGRITVQITALVFTSGVLALSVITLVIFNLPYDQAVPDNPHRSAATRIGTLIRVLDVLPPSGRASVASAYAGSDLTIELLPSGSAGPQTPSAGSHPIISLIARDLPSGSHVTSAIEQPNHWMTVSTTLVDGTAVRFDLKLEPPPVAPVPFLPPLLFLAALSIALVIWTALRIVAPLRRFSLAVDKFGVAGQAQPLAEEGPVEIRLATAAFNRMSNRIIRLIDDRTQMMMAISHDLRTPLTRLRLRAEEVASEEARRGILRDIELMESSISEAVTNLRHVSAREARVRADLPSLLESICSDFADAGYTIEYIGPDKLAATLRPQAFTRAITNLVQNATKYGTRVVVRLQGEGKTAVIDVEDDGPGIRDEEKEAVLEPFYRSDTARQDPGGFGLGLAIAFEVARDHGGILTLHDCVPHGLRARIRLLVEPI